LKSTILRIRLHRLQKLCVHQDRPSPAITCCLSIREWGQFMSSCCLPTLRAEPSSVTLRHTHESSGRLHSMSAGSHGAFPMALPARFTEGCWESRLLGPLVPGGAWRPCQRRSSLESQRQTRGPSASFPSHRKEPEAECHQPQSGGLREVFRFDRGEETEKKLFGVYRTRGLALAHECQPCGYDKDRCSEPLPDSALPLQPIETFRELSERRLIHLTSSA